MDGQQTHDAVTLLRTAVDALMSTQLAALSTAEVTGLLVEVERQKRRLEAVDQTVLAEVRERAIDGEYARTSPADLLTSLLRVSPAEAKARVERSLDLGPRRGLTGEALEPLFPEVIAAVEAGEISARHVDVITSCLERVSLLGTFEVRTVAEELLVEAARHEHPGQLAKTAQMLLARLDPDGREPKDEHLERRRGFSLAKRPGGGSVPRGELTPELTELLETMFDSLAAPVPAADGMPDDRSPAQRRHDALADAMTRLLRSDTLPPAGGAPVTILARTTMSELAAGVGVVITGHGQQISISKLLEMSADAHVIPVVCNDAGGILAFGRERRLASRGQRLALAARDGGCSFPGCDRPAAWTEAHHVREWLNDYGGTDIDNMCLLCRYHHREFAKRGWEVVMLDGVPHWRPPVFIDPERRPIRNTAHHITDFDFDFDRRAATLVG